MIRNEQIAFKNHRDWLAGSLELEAKYINHYNDDIFWSFFFQKLGASAETENNSSSKNNNSSSSNSANQNTHKCKRCGMNGKDPSSMTSMLLPESDLRAKTHFKIFILLNNIFNIRNILKYVKALSMSFPPQTTSMASSQIMQSLAPFSLVRSEAL